MSGGTDNHLALVDVTPLGVTGREAEALLDEVGITVNKNAIPFDAEPAQHRLRHPRRHAGHDDARLRARRRCAQIGRLIVEAIRARDDAAVDAGSAAEVRDIWSRASRCRA